MNCWDEIIYDMSKESNSELDAYVILKPQSMRSGSAAAT